MLLTCPKAPTQTHMHRPTLTRARRVFFFFKFTRAAISQRKEKSKRKKKKDEFISHINFSSGRSGRFTSRTSKFVSYRISNRFRQPKFAEKVKNYQKTTSFQIIINQNILYLIKYLKKNVEERKKERSIK